MGGKLDLTGKIFGDLRVLGKTNPPNPNIRNSYWKCKCKCGNIENISGTRLINGEKTMCSSCKKELRIYENFKKMIGEVYGHLKVENVIYDTKEEKYRNKYKCVCKCDCGNTVIVLRDNLTSGATTSCGCITSKIISERSQKDYTNIITETGIKFLKNTGMKNNQKCIWECLCPICEKVFHGIPSDIISSKQRSCGCLRTTYDLTNKRFGNLTVLRQISRDDVKQKNKRYWECLCDCGNLHIASTADLVSGNVYRCRECAIKSSRKDIIGKRFGRLVVKDVEYVKTDNGKSETICKCDCDCGNEHTTFRTSLISGNTTSCGCYNIDSHTKNWTNFKSKYGVIFISPTSIQSKDGSYYWNCKCPYCGNIFQALPSNINRKNNPIISCGCRSKSFHEEFIENILKENNISYKREYTFPDCKDKSFLRFDFAIFDNKELLCLIEYDGEQHFKPVDSWGGETTLKSIKERDRIKDTYCKTNNIDLYRFSYKISNQELEKEILKIVA